MYIYIYDMTRIINVVDDINTNNGFMLMIMIYLYESNYFAVNAFERSGLSGAIYIYIYTYMYKYMYMYINIYI
jgi:hypothetical protein